MANFLVTGVAGFIGSEVVKKLLKDEHCVIGLDNLNAYYDVSLKKARLERLNHKNFTFLEEDISNIELPKKAADFSHVDAVIHLAAQAGVRYSLENPYIYADTNVRGQTVMLEFARRLPNCKNFTYASSSSVYGKSTEYPLSLNDRCDKPRSIYAASKRACEHLAYAYADTYQLPATGLRFFTVYGPWGRPDMAAWLFTEAILNNKPIEVFNNGNMERDFTYIDDIVEGTIKASLAPVAPDEYGVPHHVFNLGNSNPTPLLQMIEILEVRLGKKAQKVFKPLQAGDVVKTFADISYAEEKLGFSPKTPLQVGLPRFVDWFREYHNL